MGARTSTNQHPIGRNAHRSVEQTANVSSLTSAHMENVGVITMLNWINHLLAPMEVLLALCSGTRQGHADV